LYQSFSPALPKAPRARKEDRERKKRRYLSFFQDTKEGLAYPKKKKKRKKER